MTTTTSPSFAQLHADPSRGWRAVPRWFRETTFWQAREGQHRAVIDQLFQMIATTAVVQRGTGISCARGQWAVSIEALAKASGVTYKVARRAVDHAVRAGVVGQEVKQIRLPGRTIHISLFSWFDFNSYDSANSAAGKPLGNSLGKPVGIPVGEPLGEVIQQSNTPIPNTNENTPGGITRACGPGGADAPHSRSSASSVPSAEKTAYSTNVEPKQAKAKGLSVLTLTDEQKATVAADLDCMCGYLLHGREAIGLTPDRWSALPPAAGHWAPATRNVSTPERGVSHAAMISFAAYSLNWARQQNGQPLWLMDFASLGKALATLRDQKNFTQDQIVAHISTVAHRWQAIAKSLDWMPQPIALDERVLAHAAVIEKSQAIASGQPLTQSSVRSLNGSTGQQASDFAAQLQARVGRISI